MEGAPLRTRMVQERVRSGTRYAPLVSDLCTWRFLTIVYTRIGQIAVNIIDGLSLANSDYITLPICHRALVPSSPPQPPPTRETAP